MDTREDPPIVTCPHCGANVPAGEFCGRCGAHLATGSPRRSHAYAAVPNQRVAHLAIVSTLFPHLAYRRSGPFRVAIVAGGGGGGGFAAPPPPPPRPGGAGVPPAPLHPVYLSTGA